jgi:hypothetical protein
MLAKNITPDGVPFVVRSLRTYTYRSRRHNANQFAIQITLSHCELVLPLSVTIFFTSVHQPNIMATPASSQLYIVSVDSRGKSPSDLNLYEEHVTSRTYFESHIQNNPKNTAVKSKVAELCGLDLKVYFRAHSTKYSQHCHMPKGSISVETTNGIATLLTFNPSNGLYHHVVRGKAYVLLDEGASPISKKQVWYIQMLIQEARSLYHGNDHITVAEAHKELMKWCTQYQQKSWVPRGNYETTAT